MSFASPWRAGVDRKDHRGRQERHGGKYGGMYGDADRRCGGNGCATGPDHA